MSSLRITKNYWETTMTSLQNTNMKKEIETINKGQEEMKDTISELKKIVEGIKAGLMKQRIKSAIWRTR